MLSHPFRLAPFHAPGTSASEAALALEITGIATLERNSVQITYRISGATERVKFAGPHAPSSRKNDLWRTTCFELFVKTPGGSEYWEYNFAPSGDWDVYRFASYRSELLRETQITNVSIATEVEQSRLVNLQARLPLPSRLTGHALSFGISSVIEDATGTMHYFALRHGGAKPDFHDPGNFVLSFDPAAA